MAGQIVANPSKLLELDDRLKQTVAQIDSISADIKDDIRNTKSKISDALEVGEKKQEVAYKKLCVAEAALRQAELAARNSEDGEVPSYYYRAVAMCQAEYDGVSRVCASIERIRDDFLSAASSYERKMDSFRQEYVSLLQKSSYILTQYAEFVRKSSFVSAGGNSVGNSKAFSFIFSGAASMQYSSPKSSNKSVNQERLYELSSTNQTWVTNSDGSMVFNTPQETGQKLDSCQGKVAGFLGTCGLVSCVNVLRLAGYPATEKEVVDYASSTSAGFGLGKLCTTELFPEENGGTSSRSRQQILEHYGITSELREANVNNIADAVSEGRGVIISVYAGMLYDGWSNRRDLHAITVTSVKKDRHGNVLGFYVCDSGTGGTDSSKYYASFQIENALSGRPMNVTSIIR